MSDQAANSSGDVRKRALRRAGGATAAAIVLLLVVLMLEEGNGVPAAPESAPLQAVEVQPENEPIEASAPPPSAPLQGDQGAGAQGTVVVAESSPPPVPAMPVCPEPTPAVAERPPSPPLGNGYLVQLGVFTAMENADGLRADLSARGFPAHVDGRVVLGPYPTKAAAEAARQRLRREGGPAGIIVPPRKSK